MEGKVHIAPAGRWKHTAAVCLLSVIAAALLMLLCVRWLDRLELDPLARSALLALLAYVVFRVFYPALDSLLPGGEKQRTLTWQVTEETLILGGETIPRRDIIQVHLWPERDALGHAGAGCTVNIERQGKNILLRTPGGAEAVPAAEELKALASALGWRG